MYSLYVKLGRKSFSRGKGTIQVLARQDRGDMKENLEVTVFRLKTRNPAAK